MAKVELQATGCAGGSSRICPSISICEPPRSDRKRGLAKLRLDDGLLRGCSTRAGRQLQHCRALATSWLLVGFLLGGIRLAVRGPISTLLCYLATKSLSATASPDLLRGTAGAIFNKEINAVL